MKIKKERTYKELGNGGGLAKGLEKELQKMRDRKNERSLEPH